jgi:hypothetical protein
MVVLGEVAGGFEMRVLAAEELARVGVHDPVVVRPHDLTSVIDDHAVLPIEIGDMLRAERVPHKLLSPLPHPLLTIRA